ncbi:hypothetical protein GY45DRAFT_1331880 [Cubamyces sp. BRFM 1775]|nr:hypothetical protein GY45DRAFT_1331880 [Cubamyces sp. BRFM 1775]
MPRDAITLAGLQELLDKLPRLDEVIFEASMQLCDVNLAFGDGALVQLSKEGYTRAKNNSNIFYVINITHTGLGIQTQLSVYVLNPSASPATNRKAVEKALRYFSSTESAVLTRDVDAGELESAQ